MTKQLLPLLYFGLFAAYLTVFNWGTPICWLFFAGGTLTGIQIVYPQQTWVKPLFGLAVLFSLGYVGSLLRTIFDAGSITPFLSSAANAKFAWYGAIAMLNFCMLLFWFKNGFNWQKTQNFSPTTSG